MTNSRRKGASGERAWAAFLRSHGIEARRGQQHSGSPESPDVVHDLPGVHFEVKLLGSGLNVYAALEQATRDAGPDQTPVVAYRRTVKGGAPALPWVVVMRAEDWLDLLLGRSI